MSNRVAPANPRLPRDDSYLLARAIPEPNSGCWLWLGAITPDGYSSIMLRPFVRGHALACFIQHGPQPEGMEVDHICKVRSCVNPAHTRYLTHFENIQASVGVGRKTHCKNGHPLEGDNIRIAKRRTTRGFSRVCITCESATRRARYLKTGK